MSDRRVRFSDESIQGGFSVIGGFLSWTFRVYPPLQFSLLFDYPFGRRQYGLALARPVDETPSGAFGVFRPTASVVNKININFH